MSTLSRLTQLDEAARAKQSVNQPPVQVELSEEAKALPEHIKKCTDPLKLNVQVPFFKCPSWAGLPPIPYHLRCVRDGQNFPALALDRFPYYLLGKSNKCDYVLEHVSVSAVHAAFVYHKEQGTFVIVDLRSTNGVRVNDVQIPREKPIPLAVGSVIRIGHSSRRYELRSGKAPRAENVSVKRPREPEPPAVTTSTPTASTSVPHTVPPPTPTPAEPPTTTAAVETTDPPVSEDKVYHLFQLVIKHKNVAKPKVRRTGEVVTRSKEDAVDLARFILGKHPEKMWALEEFLSVVEEYCEVRTEGKKGDLGQVSPGSYSEDFDRHVFHLSRGEVSEPFETPIGIHLVYRCD